MWMIFPILSAAGYALSTFLQNYLTDRALPRKRVCAYLVTHIVGFVGVMLVLFAIFGRGVFMLPLPVAMGLVVAGAVNMIGIALFLKALQAGDTMEVTIFGMAAPLVALALGVVFLEETVSAMQALGFVLVLASAEILVFGDKRKRNRKLSLKTAGFAFMFTLFSVLSDVIFVGVAGRNVGNFYYFGQTFFYFEMGACLVTLVCLVCVPVWRRALRQTFLGRKNGKNLVVLVLDNGAFALAEVCFKLGLMAAPAVAIMAVVENTMQLGMVFVLGVFMAMMFPRLAIGEKYNRRLLLQHLTAGILVATGIVLLG